MVTLMAAVDSGQWLRRLTFDGRGVMVASGAAAMVGDDDDNIIKWEGAMWKVLLVEKVQFSTPLVIRGSYPT